MLKISNSSELVASKFGDLIEKLTPDSIDQSKVEEYVAKELIKNLEKEGIKGEISLVSGLDVNGKQILLDQKLKVKSQTSF